MVDPKGDSLKESGRSNIKNCYLPSVQSFFLGPAAFASLRLHDIPDLPCYCHAQAITLI